MRSSPLWQPTISADAKTAPRLPATLSFSAKNGLVSTIKIRWKKGNVGTATFAELQFRSSFGMLIEIFSEGETYYMRAPVKPFDVIDLVGLKLEEELKPSTPEELYAALPPKKMKENEVIWKAEESDFWRDQIDS